MNPGRPAASASGYSGTPLPVKLGIKAGYRVLVEGLPQGWDLRQLDLDTTVRIVTRDGGSTPYDVSIAFCPDLAAVRRRLPRLVDRLPDHGRVWICWPKKASGVPTDLTDNVVRAEGLAIGVVDVKICAVDATWSGLCFMRRLRDRLD